MSFYSLSFNTREIGLLTNFRAQKARENLRRENGPEEIRRVLKKWKGAGGKKGTLCIVPFCFIKRAAS